MFAFLKNENETAANKPSFKVKDVVDASYKPEPEDTENVKRSLNKLGYYNPPDGEFTKFTETSMYDGIKNLQKEHKLTIDGRISPEGETMKKMNELLGKSSIYSQKSQTSPEWGKGTERELNKYLDNDKQYPGKTRTGILAPYNDLTRNLDDMKKINLNGSDRFFHCKANYEAIKRGNYGAALAKTMNFGREVIGMRKYGLKDSLEDWNANKKGWEGARYGKTLKEACPRNPRDYMK